MQWERETQVRLCSAEDRRQDRAKQIFFPWSQFCIQSIIARHLRVPWIEMRSIQGHTGRSMEKKLSYAKKGYSLASDFNLGGREWKPYNGF